MEDLRNRLKRETKHALDNLESLDPLQVGYKELAESIESLMHSLHIAELMICNFAEEQAEEASTADAPVEEVKAEEPVNEAPIAEAEVKTEEIKAEETKAEEPAVEEAEAAEEEPAPITKEELRAVLKDCSAIDKALLPELFKQFGAARLSEVAEKDYRALYDLAKSKLGDE